MAHRTTATSEVAGHPSGVIAPIVGATLGPVGVALYETGRLDFFQAMPLLNVWVVVGFGVFGVCLGVSAVRRHAVGWGAVCVVTNAAVVGLYGFLAAFFSFGGSR